MNRAVKTWALIVAATMLLSTAGAARASLTAYYSLDGNTNDTSGNGYNGTVNGTAAYVTGVGGIGQAFSFNGSTTISTTTTDNLGIYSPTGGSFTVDAWVNFSSPASGNDYAVFGTTTSGTDLGLHLIERGDHPFMGFYSNDVGAGATTLAANTWYNLAYVYNATTMTGDIYVSTLSGNSPTFPSQDVETTKITPFAGTGETPNIGSSCCSDDMIGAIQNLQVYNTALTPSQIFTAAQIVPEPSSIVLMSLGAAGLALAVRARRRVR